VLRLQLIKLSSEASERPGKSDEGVRVDEGSVGGRAIVQTDEGKLPLDNQVKIIAEYADRSAASLSNPKGMSTFGDTAACVDDVAAMTSSQGFSLVCGYVEKLIKIGEVVSEVNSFPILVVH
jgi:hypothetical protein